MYISNDHNFTKRSVTLCALDSSGSEAALEIEFDGETVNIRSTVRPHHSIDIEFDALKRLLGKLELMA